MGIDSRKPGRLHHLTLPARQVFYSGVKGGRMAIEVLVKAGRQHLIAVREDTPRFTGVLRLEEFHKRAAELGITSSTIAVY